MLLVEDGDGSPAVAQDQRLVCFNNGLRVRTEVDGVLGPLVQHIPAGLYVRDLEVVTDGLNVMGGPS